MPHEEKYYDRSTADTFLDLFFSHDFVLRFGDLRRVSALFKFERSFKRAPIDKKNTGCLVETDQISLKEESRVILIERKWVEKEDAHNANHSSFVIEVLAALI